MPDSVVKSASRTCPRAWAASKRSCQRERPDPASDGMAEGCCGEVMSPIYLDVLVVVTGRRPSQDRYDEWAPYLCARRCRCGPASDGSQRPYLAQRGYSWKAPAATRTLRSS